MNFLASHISFVGMATLVGFLILHRKGNMLGCCIIQKEMEFWIMGSYMLFWISTLPALLGYHVIQKERNKCFELLGLDFLYSVQYVTRIHIIKNGSIFNYEILAALILPLNTRILYNSNGKGILNYEILDGCTSDLAWFWCNSNIKYL
jgi:hypothetical protein